MADEPPLRETWKSLCLKLARHINNTDQLPVLEWGTQGLDLLGEIYRMDPHAYRHKVIARRVR